LRTTIEAGSTIQISHSWNKLQNQLETFNKTKVFDVEGVEFTVMGEGSSGNKHIGHARPMAKGIGFAQLRKNGINGFAQGEQAELVNKAHIVDKAFFVSTAQKKFVAGNGGNGKVTGSQSITPTDNFTIPMDNLNQNIGIEYYHQRKGQAVFRISVMDGKEGSKGISAQNAGSFNVDGNDKFVDISSTSFITTSTCLPNKCGGREMVWSFSVGTKS